MTDQTEQPAAADTRGVFAHFFIDRPVFAIVLSIVITLVGGIALPTLPIAEYPTTAPPTRLVTAVYHAADAKPVPETSATPPHHPATGVATERALSPRARRDGGGKECRAKK